MTQKEAIENLDNVINNIEKSRLKLNDHHIVQLVAVSKYSNEEDIRTLYNAGQRAFGENKVQDLKNKMEALDDLPIAWHFIGTLQKNKINNLIDLNPILMHSLDSIELAKELDKKLKAKNKTMNCLLQINSAYEDTKSGVSPQDAVSIYQQIKDQYTNINLKGVMSIGAHCEDKELIEKSFKTTKDIFEQIDGSICSMGMSSDYETSIINGSNMVRIGSRLFKSN
ncbi:MAG: YggS family pyridoxal phosphate-dependent enzyme [Campylobacterota bacterium]|nr:YggS family pyridoxal phosphate-dependent enzyme [Campylobacterota bacterium]